ncbi:MAG: hypothetical protein HY738_17910, partial [Bacteroidia bacterium]|nr:hypothetical protein [Bacteroidia bacterium]
MRTIFTTILFIITCMTPVLNAQQWTTQSSGTFENLNDICFTDVFHGWAVGDNGVIRFTTDGGYHWNPQTSGVTSMLNAVYFADNKTEQTSGTTLALNCISFIDNQTGWLGGNSDAIVFTNDGGQTWTSKASGYYPTTNGIWFTDINNGWAAGNNEYILHTSNGGTSWSLQNSAGQNLMDIFFIDVNTGWAVGLGGKIMKTINAGTNWTDQVTGIQEGLLSVFFNDANDGWIAGINGTILHTVNGGGAWNDETLPSVTQALQSVHFVNPSTGWICGNNGKILKKAQQQEICLVTVDSVLNKNKIIWEKVAGMGTAYYKIYKYDDTTSTYDSIGFKLYNEMSEIVDYTSNPTVKNDRYKISAVDSSGNESALSPYHQTINLAVLQGVPATTMSLHWTYYVDESGGFMSANYKIYRGTTPDNLQLYATVSNATYLYNDENVTSLFYYRVTVNKPDPCIPASGGKEQGGPYSQSLSNIDESIISGTVNEIYADNRAMRVY